MAGFLILILFCMYILTPEVNLIKNLKDRHLVLLYKILIIFLFEMLNHFMLFHVLDLQAHISFV